jgi:hypothetical protein
MLRMLRWLGTTWNPLKWSQLNFPGFAPMNCIGVACGCLKRRTLAVGKNDVGCDRYEHGMSAKDCVPAGTDGSLGSWRSSA